MPLTDPRFYDLLTLEQDVALLEVQNVPPSDRWYRYNTAETRVYRATAGWSVTYDPSGRVEWHGSGWSAGPDRVIFGNALEAARFARSVVESRLMKDTIACPPAPVSSETWSTYTPGDKAALRNILTPADLKENRPFLDVRDAAELTELEKDYERVAGSTRPVGKWYIDTDGTRFFDFEDGSWACYVPYGRNRTMVRTHSGDTHYFPTLLGAAQFARDVVAMKLEKERKEAQGKRDAVELAELEKDYVRLEPKSLLNPTDRWVLEGAHRLYTSSTGWTVAYFPEGLLGTSSAPGRPLTRHTTLLAAAKAARKFVDEQVARDEKERDAKKTPAHPTHLEVGQVWFAKGETQMVTHTSTDHALYIGNTRMVLDPQTRRILDANGATYLGRFAFTPADKE